MKYEIGLVPEWETKGWYEPFEYHIRVQWLWNEGSNQDDKAAIQREMIYWATDLFGVMGEGWSFSSLTYRSYFHFKEMSHVTLFKLRF